MLTGEWEVSRPMIEAAAQHHQAAIESAAEAKAAAEEEYLAKELAKLKALGLY